MFDLPVHVLSVQVAATERQEETALLIRIPTEEYLAAMMELQAQSVNLQRLCILEQVHDAAVPKMARIGTEIEEMTQFLQSLRRMMRLASMPTYVSQEIERLFAVLVDLGDVSASYHRVVHHLIEEMHEQVKQQEAR